MEKTVRGRTIEIEPNSAPYLLKRLISDSFDTALLFLVFMVLTLLLMKTPLAGTYEAHYRRYTEIQTETVETFGNDAAKITEALNGNEEYQYERFAANLHSYLLKVLACFMAEAVVLLLVPLFTKDRQTPGKLLTGVMPFSEKRQGRISRKQVVGRFLFVFFVDSIFWYLLTGILTFLLIPVFRLVALLVSKKQKTPADFATGVMMIEKLSYDGIN